MGIAGSGTARVAREFSYFNRISTMVFLGMMVLASNSITAQSTDGPPVESTSVKTTVSTENEEIQAFREAMRRAKNAEDMRLIRLVDSVGWIKAQMLHGSKVPNSRLEAERRERKKANLISYCNEERFKKIAEIDSLPVMTVEEKTFCRDRVRLLNPMKP